MNIKKRSLCFTSLFFLAMFVLASCIGGGTKSTAPENNGTTAEDPQTDGSETTAEAPQTADGLQTTAEGTQTTGGNQTGTTPPAYESKQLPAGHYVDRFFDMIAVNPRPDSETGSYSSTVRAHHRWAYYDGVHNIRYEVPIKVFGGAAPHWYQILEGPEGAYIENIFGDPSKHSIVKWTPQQVYSTTTPAVFKVRVYGQDGETIDLEWTCATSSSTEQFIFVSNSGNDTAGDGSIDKPFATLHKVMGSAKTETTYPGRMVYLRAGNYSTVAHSDAWKDSDANDPDTPGRVGIIETHHPVVYMAYPDEEVTIDFTGAEISIGANACDVYFAGSSTKQLVISKASENVAETHNFRIGDASKRFGWAFVTFDNFQPRVAGNFTNSAPVFSPNGTTTPARQYGYMHYVGETNRTAISDNDGLVYIFFGLQYWVDEYTFGVRSTSNGRGPHFKETCYDTSTRYADLETQSTEFSFAFMGQIESKREEIVYSRLKGRIYLNLQADFDTADLKEARNTVYVPGNNYPEGVKANPGSGGFQSINSVVISKGPVIVDDLIDSSGTECNKIHSETDFPFDTTTLKLVDNPDGTAWRSLYFGKRGFEID